MTRKMAGIAVLVGVGLTVGGLYIISKIRRAYTGPVSDQMLGLTENDVLKRYGVPQESNEGKAGQILAFPAGKGLRARLDSNTTIRALYYTKGNGEHFFWFRFYENDWHVTGDLYIPPGYQL